MVNWCCPGGRRATRKDGVTMLYPESRSPRLDAGLFRRPAASLRGVPFWSWNCRVTRALIDAQLDAFAAMGFGGVDIHPRTGLDVEYLGDEFMDLIRYAVAGCKARGLYCWLYDDDRFPSGAAGGLVTRDVRHCQRFLLLTETPGVDCLPDRARFEAALEAGERPAGYLAARYALTLENGGLVRHRRLEEGEAARPGERLRYGCVMLLEPEEWFQGRSYVDVMDPGAIRAFIDITHEAYFRNVGADFGGVVPAIFTDEPRMETRTKRPKALADGDSHGDVILPWSEPLRARMIRERGVDPLDIAPELAWEWADGRPSAARAQFRDAACEQFVAAYMDQIAGWCRAHGILMTGHVLSEDTLYAQAASLGEAMRCYRSMDIPGVDVLCDDRAFLAVKQAASVAHQLGREGVASELYGVTLWNADFKTFKLQGDWQAALGVTARVPHLAWMSMEGEAKRDWPGSIFTQQPWWREYAAIEDYFARLNAALTRGRPMIDVAVIHPVETMWLHLGTNAGTKATRQELDARFDALVNGLLLRQVDFDLISESMLPGLDPRCDAAGLHVGRMTYRTVIVPDMQTIRATTLDVLERFRAQGGRILFAGSIPGLVDVAPSDRARRLAERCAVTGGMEALYGAMRDALSLHVRRADGGCADNLLVQRRRDGECEWLFLAQAFPRRERPYSAEDYAISIRGRYAAEAWDALTGEIRPVPVRYADRGTVIPWRAFAEDSLLLRLMPGEAEIPVSPEVKWRPCATLLRPESVCFSEPNMLLLDYAAARVDGGEWLEKREILRLDNAIRALLGYRPRCGSMRQPWATEAGEARGVTLRYEFLSEAAMDAELALEHPEACTIQLNGGVVEKECRGHYVDQAIRRIALRGIVGGVNTLEVRLAFDQKTNLEPMYLLGDFCVEPRLAGDSVLLPRVRAHGLGDLARQGMPFWSGTATYRFALDIGRAGIYAVQVPRFAAAVLKLRLDGADRGLIAWAPHRLELGRLEPGAHVLEIDAFVGRHNGFGALHNANDAFRWYGPDAWRTEGDEWTDDYQLLPAGLLSGVELWIQE